MKDFLKYLSTAPVLLTAWMTFTAGFVIEINRFYPDALTFPFQILQQLSPSVEGDRS